MIAIYRQFLIKLCARAWTWQSSLRKATSARRAPELVACYILVGTAVALGLDPLYHARSPLPLGAAAAQDSQENPTPDTGTAPPLTGKQKRGILKSNFEKLKQDADELAVLAKSLQEDIDHSNQNVLSLKVVERAEKIEKLARKIKTAAKL